MRSNQSPDLSISIVSHCQAELVQLLLDDLREHCSGMYMEVILTVNVEEHLLFDTNNYGFPILVIRNVVAKGFGENHNAAFSLAKGEFFCVLNPDIRLINDPFAILLASLKDPAVGVAAPLVLDEGGEIEDSARRFPTPLKIFCKLFGRCRGGDYVIREATVHPDWVGGMFMLFPRDVFKQLGGFDQRYFLYYEDVDLCARLRLSGYEAAICPQARVIHHAHRSSHRSLRYLRWHLASMLRFFLSPVYWRVLCRKWL